MQLNNVLHTNFIVVNYLNIYCNEFGGGEIKTIVFKCEINQIESVNI